MKHMAISLETLSPLAIRADHAPGGMATMPYIPGSTLLGGLAAAHRRLRGEQEEEFERWFTHSQMLYPNLYPAAFKDDTTSSLPVYPVPRTAQSCKRHRGFLPEKPEEEDKEYHGVRDTLFDWAVYELVKQQKDDTIATKVLESCEVCPKCGEAMDHFDGYYWHDPLEPERFHAASVDSRKRLRTHTGINRALGSVQEDILYNRQVFEENVLFWGELRLPDDQDSEGFRKFLEDAVSAGLVRLGTARSRGMGKVALSAKEIEPEEDSHAQFKTRLLNFDHELRSYMQSKMQAMGINSPQLAPFYVAVTLHSPVILCDDGLRYYGTIDGKTLGRCAHLSSSPFERIFQVAGMQRVLGWSDLWGMPREHEFAIETGSVFLYACNVEPDDPLFDALYGLEEQGIGRRKVEGYGRILFSDPFHLEVKLR